MHHQANTVVQLLPAVGMMIYIPFAIWSARDYNSRCGRVNRPLFVRAKLWLHYWRERRAERRREHIKHAQKINDAEFRRLRRERLMQQRKHS